MRRSMTEHYARSPELKRGSTARFGSFSDEAATTAPEPVAARTLPVASRTTSAATPATPGTANPRAAPPHSTTGPARPVPTDAPTVNVVTSQEKASVTVPAGACRSTSTKAQAIQGARNTPASVARAVIATGPGTSV